MSALVEQLRGMGCDMDGAMERFLHDEVFYQEMYREVMTDPAFDSLGEAIEMGDATAAFESAHLIKGLTGNMGLSPLYAQISRLVEQLRRKSLEGAWPLYQGIMETLGQLRALNPDG